MSLCHVTCLPSGKETENQNPIRRDINLDTGALQVHVKGILAL